MRHIINVTVENKFGVLARISGLFSSRGYNIDSLTVGETNDPSVSRMTIIVKGEEQILDQVIKQLDKLIDVIEVSDLPAGSYVGRELLVMKISSGSGTRTEILELANIFDAKTIDIGLNSMTLRITGDEGKIKAFITMMQPFGIIELARTGTIAMVRDLNGNSSD